MRAPDRIQIYLILLAIASGVVDAASYLGLGRMFTANMTGNTVLLGVAVATGSGGDAARAAAALGGFCLGVALGTALIPSTADAPWPRVAARPLALALLALAALLAGWAAAGVASLRFGLIATSAIAMGAQSAAVRATRTGGVATTYVTGTLANAIGRLVNRARPGVREDESPGLAGGVWFVYGVAALAGALAEKAWHAWAVLPAIVILGVVTAAAARR